MAHTVIRVFIELLVVETIFVDILRLIRGALVSLILRLREFGQPLAWLRWFLLSNVNFFSLTYANKHFWDLESSFNAISNVFIFASDKYETFEQYETTQGMSRLFSEKHF